MNLLIFSGYSGFAQRFDNVAAIIQAQFDATVDCLVFGEDNYRYLTKTPKAAYREVVCVEHLRRADRTSQPHAAALRALEEKLGHSLTELAYAERYFVLHTHVLPARRRLSQQEIIDQVLGLAADIDRLVMGADMVLAYTCASIESELLYYLAKARGIPFYTLNERRIGYEFSLVDNNMDTHHDLLALYRDPAFDPGEAGQARFESYRDRLLQNQKNKVQTDYQSQRMRRKALTPANLLRFAKGLLLNRDSMHQAPSRMQRIQANLRIKARERYVKRNMPATLPDRPFVYFALTTVPEASTLIRAPRHYDQLGLIKRLSLEMPLDWVLLVREHPGMVGYNPVDFYKAVGDIFNVRFASPFSDPTDYILRSETVITITGTTGMESLALGKKTIVLGQTIYSDLESVHRVTDTAQIGPILRREWGESDSQAQARDLARLAGTMEALPGIEDPDNILWTANAFDPATYAVDRNIAAALAARIDATAAQRQGDRA